MEQEIKKTRAPRSEESKAKTRATMKARADALRAANDGKAATPETIAKMKIAGAKGGKNRSANGTMKRLDGTKAQHLVIELLDFVNDLRTAEESKAALETLQAAWPENEYRYSKNGDEIEFSRSTTEIKKMFGTVGLTIWKKVFKCIQQGGYSEKENKGFPSVWALNKVDWEKFTIAKMKVQSKLGRKQTVSAWMMSLLDAEEYKRVGTVLVVDKVRGVPAVVAKQKRMTTKEERAEIAAERAQLKKDNNIKPAQTYRQMFVERKKLHAEAVAASRELAAKEMETS